MRMKSWKPNIELLEKNKVLYDLYDVQFLPPPQELAQIQGFICVYTSSMIKMFVISPLTWYQEDESYLEYPLPMISTRKVYF